MKNNVLRKIGILGFGREGRAIFSYLKKNEKYKKPEIWILDLNKNIEIPKRTRAVLGDNYLENLNNFDIIYRSPGIPYNLTFIQQAIKNGIEISSATKIFFENHRGRIVGITGTKGKGTTSTLLYEILKNSGLDVYLAGNIGKPAIKILPRLKNNSVTVLELSSFQLQDLRISPDIAAVLDIFPDHQDSHKSFKEYVDAKASIAKYQKSSDIIFFSADNKYSKLIANLSPANPANKIPVSSNISSSQDDILRGALQIPGKHNIKNALMAAAIARYLGSKEKLILKTIENFRGLEHRLEFVRKINGIDFYNDSASTNPQTTIAAVTAFKEPKILIAGGRDKNLDYSPWIKILKDNNVRLVILFGENKNKIRKALEGQKLKFEVKMCDGLKTAIEIAYKKAEELTSLQAYKPIIIIFSPGSASFDMFKDYADRGNTFKKFVNVLK